MKQRSPISVILFSFITCGIYGWFWMAATTEETNGVAKDEWKPSGMTAVILSIVTVGIYLIYWYIKMALRAAKMSNQSATLTIVLFFLFPIAVPAVIQSQLNSVSGTKEAKAEKK